MTDLEAGTAPHDGAGDGAGDGTHLAALRRENQDLREALVSQPVIEQAKGALMLRYGFDPERAFAVLVRLSQGTNTKVRDIAETLVRAVVLGDTDHGAPALVEELERLLGRDGADPTA